MFDNPWETLIPILATPLIVLLIWGKVGRRIGIPLPIFLVFVGLAFGPVWLYVGITDGGRPEVSRPLFFGSLLVASAVTWFWVRWCRGERGPAGRLRPPSVITPLLLYFAIGWGLPMVHLIFGRDEWWTIRLFGICNVGAIALTVFWSRRQNRRYREAVAARDS